MSLKPCLIFSNYELRPTDGGPSGFLGQNLQNCSSEFYQLGQAKSPPSTSLTARLSRRWSQATHRVALRQRGLPAASYYEEWLIGARRIYVREGAERYAWIWFHDVWSMAACLDLIPRRQRVILQAHCPELPSTEAANQGIGAADVHWTQEAERRVFARADVCVLPHEDARQIYASVLSAESRVEYLLSGSKQLKPRHILPLDPQFVYYLFIGRRIPIKGFDIALAAFERAHRENPSLRLLVVGGGEVVSHPAVIDVGRSEMPENWLAACDYLLSANRQSYFDLSVMEALSLGTPLIIACTGGHRYYRDLESPGIAALSEASAEAFSAAMLANRVKRSANGTAVAANRKLYAEHLSSEQYRARLDRLLAQLIRS